MTNLHVAGKDNLIANYIPMQNALLNFLPKNLNKSSSGLLIIILGLIFGGLWLPILSQSGALSIIDTIASFIDTFKVFFYLPGYIQIWCFI